MVNVERVIHSARLGCQHVTVLRSDAMWLDGQYVISDFDSMGSIISPSASLIEEETSIVNTAPPSGMDDAEVINSPNADPTTRIVMDAIVTIASQKDLQQVPEGDRVAGSMKFLTAERLYLTSGERFSDVVVWRDAKYRIITVSPNIDYGFYRSIGIRLEGDGIG